MKGSGGGRQTPQVITGAVLWIAWDAHMLREAEHHQFVHVIRPTVTTRGAVGAISHHFHVRPKFAVERRPSQGRFCRCREDGRTRVMSAEELRVRA